MILATLTRLAARLFRLRCQRTRLSNSKNHSLPNLGEHFGKSISHSCVAFLLTAVYGPLEFMRSLLVMTPEQAGENSYETSLLFSFFMCSSRIGSAPACDLRRRSGSVQFQRRMGPKHSRHEHP